LVPYRLSTEASKNYKIVIQKQVVVETKTKIRKERMKVRKKEKSKGTKEGREQERKHFLKVFTLTLEAYHSRYVSNV
jgi:hypothetical protein